MKIVIQAKENLKNIFDEAFGENIDHPLLRRFLAFLLDYVIFNFSGALVYLMLNVINYHSEINQLVIELSILTFYLTLGYSHWFGGQTVGKKILRIKVVDSNGEFLGLVRSFLRSIIPVLLMNGLLIMRYVISEHDYANSIVYLSLFSLLFATIYFSLLKLNRQTLHDMLVSSQVIMKNQNIKLKEKTDWVLVLTCITIVSIYIYNVL